MTRGARLAAALGAALVASAGAEEPRLRPWTRGSTPALAGVGLGDREIELGALRGRVVLVAFWASWCEGCGEHLAGIAKLKERLRGRKFDVLTVNYGEGPARVDQVLRDLAIELPVLLDRDHRAARAWGVGGLPMTFLVDAEGRVRSSAFGAMDFGGDELAAALDPLLAEADRAPRTAR